MKKVILFFIVFIFVAPAWAQVGPSNDIFGHWEVREIKDIDAFDGAITITKVQKKPGSISMEPYVVVYDKKKTALVCEYDNSDKTFLCVVAVLNTDTVTEKDRIDQVVGMADLASFLMIDIDTFDNDGMRYMNIMSLKKTASLPEGADIPSLGIYERKISP